MRLFQLNSYFSQLGPPGQFGVSAAKNVVGVKRNEAESVTTDQEDQAQLVALTTTTTSATTTTTTREDGAEAATAVEMIWSQNVARKKLAQVEDNSYV